MKVIQARNVNHAYQFGLAFLKGEGLRESSRNGDVIRAQVPVTTVYENPRERVLFDTVRDANPFFHFLEGLWMLAGRQDVKWVAEFASRMTTYSDDGETMNGAYGFRWRQYFLYDQIHSIVLKLRKDPTNRRLILGMWNPARDLMDQTSKDLPCNLACKFFVRNTDGSLYLDMHVYCRSNDIVWGAYGANAVHMSMLLEYVATMAGMLVGRYYQISSDYHAYVEVFEKVTAHGIRVYPQDPYMMSDDTYPGLLVKTPQTFDVELEHFITEDTTYMSYHNPALTDAECMRKAWRAYKGGDILLAIEYCLSIRAGDWRLACIAWIHRRSENKGAK